MGADFESNLTAINNNCLFLQVRLPYFFGVALRKANIVAVLLAFTDDVAFTHYYSPIQLYILAVFTS